MNSETKNFNKFFCSVKTTHFTKSIIKQFSPVVPIICNGYLELISMERMLLKMCNNDAKYSN